MNAGFRFTCSTFCVAVCLQLALLAGCARREAEAPPAEAQRQASQALSLKSNEPGRQSDPAKPAPAARKIVAPIKVTVVPSPAAKQRLAQEGESIVVEAVYGGDPAPGSSAVTNALGVIELGTAVEELPAEGGTVGFSDSLVDKEKLSTIAGQPQIMFNVRSSQKTRKGNLLSCQLYWDSIAAASSVPAVQIPCDVRAK